MSEDEVSTGEVSASMPPEGAAPVAVPPETAVADVPPNPRYPARMEVDYPEHSSRLLIFVRGILAIPHFIVLMFLGIGAAFALIGVWFAVLFTARFPRGIFNFLVGLLRWSHRVWAYLLFMTDKYPPFSLEDDPSYPVRIEVDELPEMHIARWRALIQWLMAYPALIAAGGLMFVAYFAAIGAFFGILFTGHYPKGLFRFVTVSVRWTLRTSVYQYLMTEQYPPFIMA